MTQQEEIIKITETLIDCINRGDFPAYEKLCDPQISCFEPESLGHLITGMTFHKFYFDNLLYHKPINTTLIEPKVHILGNDVACIAYIRLTQFLDKDGLTHSTRAEETRLWRKKDNEWRCLHFHRSVMGESSSTKSSTLDQKAN